MWEIKWISNQRGTHACVGVATRKAPIRKVNSEVARLIPTILF